MFLLFYEKSCTMFQSPLQEISRQVINITKIDDTSISWHNSAIAVRTTKGIHVYELTYDLKCMDKKLDFTEFIIPTPKSSPATYLLSNNFVSLGVSNFQLSQLIVDPSLWPHNPQIVQEMACVIDCRWSPNEFNFYGEPLLLTLNNIGNVDIFGKMNGAWTNLADLSACLYKEFNLALPKYVEDLKKKADIVESSAVSWAPTPREDGSCCIVLGQRNGHLLFWCLNIQDTKVKAEYKGCIKSDSDEVKAILWIDKGDGVLLLVVSNILGQITLYNCKESDHFEIVNSHCIWPHQDKMVSQYLCHTEVNNKTIIFFDKHRHFVAQMLDENNKVVSQYAEIVNDYKISTIIGNLNDHLLGTINLKMYKIYFQVSNDNLIVRLHLIETKESYTNIELFGLTLSKNNQMVAAVVLNRTLSFRKKTPYLYVMFLSTDSNENSVLSFLLNNNERSVFKLWDGIELLRYKIIKSKTLPNIDLRKLIIDGNTDIFKLKLYLVIASVWKALEDNLKVQLGLLPEGIEKVKETIMLKHAQSQLNEMYNMYMQNNSLSNFELEIFIATKRYIRYFCQKYNIQVNDVIPSEVFNSVKCENRYTCQCCDDEIDWFSCKNGHINMFCPITFTPIETNEYILCKICGITIRSELIEKRAMCIFCDRYLQRHWL